MTLLWLSKVSFEFELAKGEGGGSLEKVKHDLVSRRSLSSTTN